MSSRFTLPLRRTMRRRARQILAGLPADALRRAVPTDARSDILWPLLPAPVRRQEVLAS
jgi:hypothetical protein